MLKLGWGKREFGRLPVAVLILMTLGTDRDGRRFTRLEESHWAPISLSLSLSLSLSPPLVVNGMR